MGDRISFVDRAETSWYKFETAGIPIFIKPGRSDEELMNLSRRSPVINGLKAISCTQIYAPLDKRNEDRDIVRKLREKNGEDSMKNNFNIPWKRYGLIAELAERLEKKARNLERSHCRKWCTCFKKSLALIAATSLNFTLMAPSRPIFYKILIYVEHMGGMSVRPVLFNNWGYEIHPGEKPELIRKKAADFLNAPEVSGTISTLVGEFGNHWTKDLELRSTIGYVERDFKRHCEEPSTLKAIRIVKHLNIIPRDFESKPFFQLKKQGDSTSIKATFSILFD